MDNKTVNIMGTEYTIEIRNAKDDDILNNHDGYTDYYSKLIVIDDGDGGDIHDVKRYQKKVLRHEITHAFLYESGLAHNSCHFESAWARNEEMIDWFAIQGEKIYQTWAKAGALDG